MFFFIFLRCIGIRSIVGKYLSIESHYGALCCGQHVIFRHFHKWPVLTCPARLYNAIVVSSHGVYGGCDGACNHIPVLNYTQVLFVIYSKLYVTYLQTIVPQLYAWYKMTHIFLTISKLELFWGFTQSITSRQLLFKLI